MGWFTACCSSCRRADSPLTTPLISDNPESLVEDRLFGEGSCELLDERLEPFLWHIWDQFVEHAALAKRRVGACLAGVRLQVAIVAQRLVSGPEQRQQRDGACVEQPQPIPPGRRADTHCTHPHAEAEVLSVTQAALDAPPLAVERHQRLGGRIGGAGGQVPSLLHLLV